MLRRTHKEVAEGNQPQPRIIFTGFEDAFEKLGIGELYAPMMDKNRGRNFEFTLGAKTDEDRLSLKVKPTELDANKDPKRVSVIICGKDKGIEMTLVQLAHGVGLEEAALLRINSSYRLAATHMGCLERSADQEYPLTEVIFAMKRAAQKTLELGDKALPGDLRDAHAFLEERFEIIDDKTKSFERDFARRTVMRSQGQPAPVLDSDS